jgi:hypothetical protein
VASPRELLRRGENAVLRAPGCCRRAWPRPFPQSRARTLDVQDCIASAIGPEAFTAPERPAVFPWRRSIAGRGILDMARERCLEVRSSSSMAIEPQHEGAGLWPISALAVLVNGVRRHRDVEGRPVTIRAGE